MKDEMENWERQSATDHATVMRHLVFCAKFCVNTNKSIQNVSRNEGNNGLKYGKTQLSSQDYKQENTAQGGYAGSAGVCHPNLRVRNASSEHAQARTTCWELPWGAFPGICFFIYFLNFIEV